MHNQIICIVYKGIEQKCVVTFSKLVNTVFLLRSAYLILPAVLLYNVPKYYFTIVPVVTLLVTPKIYIIVCTAH